MKNFTLILLFLTLPAQAEFKNESEAGVVITNGNSRSQSYSVKNKSDYVQEKNSYVFTGTYLQSQASGVKSAESWNLGLRYERAITDVLSAFLGQAVEGDKFAGILQRYNTDLGAKYFFAKTEKEFIWFAEGGYRFTKEHTTREITTNFQKARFYSEAEKFWNPSVSTKLWAEYIPNFTVSQNWLFNSELSLSAALNSIFAVKSGIMVRYNNAPPVPSAQKADTTVTTALTAKF